MVRVRVASCLVCWLVHGWCSITNILMLNIMHQCCLVSYQIILLHFGVNKMIIFQKLVRSLDKMTITNLGRQHQRSLTLIWRVWEYLYLFGFISYFPKPSIFLMLLNPIVYIFKLTFLVFLHFLNSNAVCHINKRTPPQYDIFCISRTCHTKEGMYCSRKMQTSNSSVL